MFELGKHSGLEESQEVEFKTTGDETTSVMIMFMLKYFTAFFNAGVLGTLYIGIDDNGIVVGHSIKSKSSDLDNIRLKFAETTTNEKIFRGGRYLLGFHCYSIDFVEVKPEPDLRVVIVFKVTKLLKLDIVLTYVCENGEECAPLRCGPMVKQLTLSGVTEFTRMRTLINREEHMISTVSLNYVDKIESPKMTRADIVTTENLEKITSENVMNALKGELEYLTASAICSKILKLDHGQSVAIEYLQQATQLLHRMTGIEKRSVGKQVCYRKLLK
jgi:hypothetical protein